MPLKLIKRKGSPYWQITGTYCGVRVRESTQTDDRRIAEKIRVEREHEIQHAKGSDKQHTVSHAIVEYIENGGENKYLHLINEHLGQIPLDEVNQHSIDRAANSVGRFGIAKTVDYRIGRDEAYILRQPLDF